MYVSSCASIFAVVFFSVVFCFTTIIVNNDQYTFVSSESGSAELRPIYQIGRESGNNRKLNNNIYLFVIHQWR